MEESPQGHDPGYSTPSGMGGSWIGEYDAALKEGAALIGTDVEQAAELLGRAVEIASMDLDDDDLLASAYKQLSAAYHRLGDHDASAEVSFRVSSLNCNQSVLASIYRSQAGYIVQTHGVKRSIPAYRAARDTSRAAGDTANTAITYSDFGHHLFYIGRERFALGFFRRAAELLQPLLNGERPNSENLEFHALKIEVITYIITGELAGAWDILRSHEETWRQDAYIHAVLLKDLAGALIRKGKLERAKDPVTLAARLLTTSGCHMATIEMLLLSAWLHRAMRQWQQAYGDLARAKELIDEFGDYRSKARLYVTHRDFCEDSGAHDAVRHLSDAYEFGFNQLSIDERDALQSQIEDVKALFLLG